MSARRAFAVLLLLAAAACAPQIVSVTGTPPEPTVIVPPTVPPGTEEAAYGAVTGRLSYPEGELPVMRVAAINTATNMVSFVDTTPNQADYEITGLPAGSYHVIAYSIGGNGFSYGIAGGYTAAVPCGLGAGCDSHKLIPVTVGEGQAVTDVDPGDWNMREIPAMPNEQTAATGTGSIRGTLSFPPEFIPSMKVVAIPAGSGVYFTETMEGQSTYSISLPAGDYVIALATLSGAHVGGYTQAVICGMTADCADHAALTVTVRPNETLEGIDLLDWSVPAGTFPVSPPNQP